MNRRALFADHHADSLNERIEQFWDLSWPLPVPRETPTCPGCGAAMILKDWRFHTRASGTKHPWRFDVRLKCLGCSLVTIYGIPVPKTSQPAATGWITWREGKQLLTDAGYFGEGE